MRETPAACDLYKLLQLEKNLSQRGSISQQNASESERCVARHYGYKLQQAANNARLCVCDWTDHEHIVRPANETTWRDV